MGAPGSPPVRGRELKLFRYVDMANGVVAPRAGAGIEIRMAGCAQTTCKVAPHAGARIEIWVKQNRR